MLIFEPLDRRWTKDERLIRLPQEDCCQALSVPPTRQYQSDGDPGLRAILELLKGSDTPDDNIAAFMRANIIFWLLGATGGHAKNFSIFLTPGGRFRMTLLHDVLSAQPSTKKPSSEIDSSNEWVIREWLNRIATFNFELGQ